MKNGQRPAPARPPQAAPSPGGHTPRLGSRGQAALSAALPAALSAPRPLAGVQQRVGAALGKRGLDEVVIHLGGVCGHQGWCRARPRGKEAVWQLWAKLEASVSPQGAAVAQAAVARLLLTWNIHQAWPLRGWGQEERMHEPLAGWGRNGARRQPWRAGVGEARGGVFAHALPAMQPLRVGLRHKLVARGHGRRDRPGSFTTGLLLLPRGRGFRRLPWHSLSSKERLGRSSLLLSRPRRPRRTLRGAPGCLLAL